VSRVQLDVLERQLEARDADVRLMLQVRDGVQGAFEELVRRYQDRLVGILYHLIGSRDEAEDLAQEVFLRIYKARQGYRPRARFSTWLFTIANNLALNHLRGKKRNPSVPMSGAASDSQAVAPIAQRLAARESTASSQIRKVELAEIVQEAIGVLNEDQRMAVLLNKFEELSYAEIGEVMNRSPAAIKSLLARARNELRERLEPYLTTGSRGPFGGSGSGSGSSLKGSGPQGTPF
jgi:RNA polymerase sigma-70 factor (ECF subfamily)